MLSSAKSGSGMYIIEIGDILYHAGDNTTSEPFRLFNLDVFEYETNSNFGLYGAIPMMIAHTAKATVGAFW